MTKAYIEKKLTERGRTLRRALRMAVNDPTIKSDTELARFLDWYLSLTAEKAATKKNEPSASPHLVSTEDNAE